jgi:hypothetical protein
MDPPDELVPVHEEFENFAMLVPRSAPHCVLASAPRQTITTTRPFLFFMIQPEQP